MEELLHQLTSNINFPLILNINIITYMIIKFIDDINKDKVVTTWQKRIVFIISSIICGIVYKSCSNIPLDVIINSCIIAPVSWSWIIKPIAKKCRIDYKQLENK